MAARRPYAAGTEVPVSRTQEQIKSELQRLGAGRRLIYEDDDGGQAVVAFERAGIQYRITLPLPSARDQRYLYTPSRGIERTAAQALAAWQQDCRARWRALAEYIKSMRVAKETEIVTAETLLLPYAVIGEGQTVDDWLTPQIPAIQASGHLPPLLPGLEAPGRRAALQLPAPTRLRIEEAGE